MWNGAKKAMRRLGRRTVRQVEGDEQPPLENVEQEIPNIAGEKFIVDLYKNLTNSVSTVQRATQANTIRSLKYNRGVYFLLCSLGEEFCKYNVCCCGPGN